MSKKLLTHNLISSILLQFILFSIPYSLTQDQPQYVIGLAEEIKYDTSFLAQLDLTTSKVSTPLFFPKIPERYAVSAVMDKKNQLYYVILQSFGPMNYKIYKVDLQSMKIIKEFE